MNEGTLLAGFNLKSVLSESRLLSILSAEPLFILGVLSIVYLKPSSLLSDFLISLLEFFCIDSASSSKYTYYLYFLSSIVSS